MPPSPYDTCPCGSGKKFKWCCTPYFDRIEKALDQQQNGQHDGAVATMQQLVAELPKTPQVWGYYANILFAEGKVDEAETALDKAIEIQPDFGMAYLLRGLFRQAEGEMIGALLLFRKASEAYNPDAGDQLAQTNELIARHELQLNRPVACRAALEKATKAAPNDVEMKQQFEALFGPDARMPNAARKAYSFRPTGKPLPEAAAAGKLSAAKAAFEQLAAAHPNDAAVQFNLGLTKAWLGEQPAAVAALTKSLDAETDDFRAEETAALIEVLKCGQGMENDADTVDHRVVLPIRDPQAVMALLQAWDQEGRMIAPQQDPEGQYFSCMLGDEIPSLLETGTKLSKITAHVTVAGGIVRLSHPVQEIVAKVGQEIRDRLNLAVGEPVSGVGPIQLGDIVLEALAFPVRAASIEEAEKKMSEHASGFYEGVWLQRMRKSLGNAAPVDAAGSMQLRKRLLGVLRFEEDCLNAAAPQKQSGEKAVPFAIYDFARLRHKLGLTMTAAVPAGPSKDFGGMSAADLAGVDRASLSVTEAEEAMRAAIKLDARELAVAFAKAGTDKPADAAKPDRYPLFACRMTAALAAGQFDDAVAVAEAGTADDAANNGGKRAGEYGLRKAAVLLKAGKVDAAAAAFDATIAANPTDGNLYVKAAEAMLSGKQGAKAAAFAERGLTAAKESGNRDVAGACEELLAAAKKYS